MQIVGNTPSGGKKPSTPVIGIPTAGNASASVAFTPSTYIGKGTITYTATSSPGNITGSGSSSPINVTGLTNGVSYTFTVVGTTNYGVSSDPSSASTAITPVAPPTYALAPNTTSANEGTTVTFTVTTTNFGSGTLYWTLEGVSGTVNNSDFSSPANAVTSGGSVAISGNTGSFSVTLSNDSTTEGAESFLARLRIGSTGGTVVATSATVTINDTSTTPVIIATPVIINEPVIINTPVIIDTGPVIINTPVIIDTGPVIINEPVIIDTVTPCIPTPFDFCGSLGGGTYVLTLNGFKTVNDLAVGDELLSLDISEIPTFGPGFDLTNWMSEQFTNNGVVTTTITSISTRDVERHMLINGDWFSESHYILARKYGIHSFVMAANMDTSYEVYNYQTDDWTPVTDVIPMNVNLTVYSINCEPYDIFFTENMLVYNQREF